MTGELQGLREKKYVPLILLNVPNGANVVVNIRGSVSLSSKLNLDKVLYVTNFALQSYFCGSINSRIEMHCDI